MSRISDFYQGETKKFRTTITLASNVVDISGDTVTWYLKNTKTTSDVSASLTINANVSGSGTTGVAIFSGTSSQTSGVSSGEYWSEQVWIRNNGERYILQQQQLKVLETVSDPPS